MSYYTFFVNSIDILGPSLLLVQFRTYFHWDYQNAFIFIYFPVASSYRQLIASGPWKALSTNTLLLTVPTYHVIKGERRLGSHTNRGMPEDAKPSKGQGQWESNVWKAGMHESQRQRCFPTSDTYSVKERTRGASGHSLDTNKVSLVKKMT